MLDCNKQLFLLLIILLFSPSNNQFIILSIKKSQSSEKCTSNSLFCPTKRQLRKPGTFTIDFFLAIYFLLTNKFIYLFCTIVTFLVILSFANGKIPTKLINVGKHYNNFSNMLKKKFNKANNQAVIHLYRFKQIQGVFLH